MSFVQITPGAEIATGSMPPDDQRAVNDLIERLDDGNVTGAVEVASMNAYRVRAHGFWLVFDRPEPNALRILDVVPNTRARVLYGW